MPHRDCLGGLAGISSSSEVMGVEPEVVGEDSSRDSFEEGSIISVGAAEESTESICFSSPLIDLCTHSSSTIAFIDSIIVPVLLLKTR
jgi:hypothetical protein